MHTSIVLQCMSPRHFHTFNVTSELFMSYHVIFDCQIIMEVISHLNNKNALWCCMDKFNVGEKSVMQKYLVRIHHRMSVSEPGLPHRHRIYMWNSMEWMNKYLNRCRGKLYWDITLGLIPWAEQCMTSDALNSCSFEVDVSVPQINMKSGFLLYWSNSVTGN